MVGSIAGPPIPAVVYPHFGGGRSRHDASETFDRNNISRPVGVAIAAVTRTPQPSAGPAPPPNRRTSHLAASGPVNSPTAPLASSEPVSLLLSECPGVAAV